jgi:hypothetical protein
MNNSDSEDDSIRLGQPTGWDGWHLLDMISRHPGS